MNDGINGINLINPEEWDNIYENIQLVKDDDSQYNPIRDLIKKYVNKNNGDCIEIGCFPGRFITIFGDLGYTLYGIDITRRVEKDLPDWLENSGYNVGKFERIDFEFFHPDKKFDIVCSFGFIEHFTNWESIFKKHLSLVKAGGYLIVTTPNFMGFIQMVLHKKLDEENFQQHNTKSMDPLKWANIARENNFTVLFNGYCGGFEFWENNKNQSWLQKFLIKNLYRISRYGHDIPNSKLYSPYSAIVAKKLNNK